MATLRQIRNRLKSEATAVDVEVEFEQYNPPFQCVVPQWEDPPEILIPTEDDIGENVWIADKPSTFNSILVEIDEEEGQCKIKSIDRRSDRGIGSTSYLLLGEIILHPEYLDRERVEKYYEIKDGRKA